MTDRERILRLIRQGLGFRSRPSPVGERPKTSAIQGGPSIHGTGVPSQHPARQFKREAELQSVTVYEAADATGAGRVLSQILDRLSAERVVTWDDPVLERADVKRVLLEKGIDDLTLHSEDPAHPPDRYEHTARAARAEAGITAADWALADTGTLVLLSGPGRSRAASLLPPVHVALLPASRILSDSGELLKRLPANPADAPALESSLTLITGTSKTADIELTLVRGVHGPGEVHVILISNDAA